MSRAWALVASLALLGPLVSAVSTYVEVPQETTVNGTEYSISELTSKLFVRTDEFELNATSCLQYSFHFKERRVRSVRHLLMTHW
ncbi:unnamed protein product [Caenorhabditis auriculariae]|uniref:Uncharacterized protein n=1 Tax=Caenorhabditis auriculariae TaxID=2777116 RepID=A0A8S1HIZ0_9PELO|nr:unnamed protein product [Caenorhabditis auriculariae]